MKTGIDAIANKRIGATKVAPILFYSVMKFIC